MDNKVIVLLKNNSFVLTDDWVSFYKDARYIMVPSDNQLHTYVLLEPNKVMKLLHEADIKVEMVVLYQDHSKMDYDSKIVPFGNVRKTLHGMVEVIQYLQSLNRISYTNGAMKNNDAVIQLGVYFLYFKIKCYDENHRKIFVFKKHDGVLIRPNDILKVLAEAFYEPVVDQLSYIRFNLSNQSWMFQKSKSVKIKKELYKSHMFAIPLTNTSTYYFINARELDILKSNLRGIMCQTYVYDDTINEEDMHDISKQFCNIDVGLLNGKTNFVWMFDQWLCTLGMIIEFFVYLPYLYVIIQTTNQVNDNDGEVKGNYHSSTYLYIDTYDRRLFDDDVHCTDKFAFTVNDIVKILEGDQNE